MQIQVNHDVDRGMFKTRIENDDAFLNYRKKGPDKLEFYETFVPKEHRGQKIASQMAKEALDFAEENDLRVIPTCSFVKSYVEKNDEYKKIVTAS